MAMSPSQAKKTVNIDEILMSSGLQTPNNKQISLLALVQSFKEMPAADGNTNLLNFNFNSNGGDDGMEQYLGRKRRPVTSKPLIQG